MLMALVPPCLYKIEGSLLGIEMTLFFFFEGVSLQFIELDFAIYN